MNDTLKETIVNDLPRMKKDDKFCFGCNPSVSCFNKCCNDVNIFLTPYDIIRLRKRLGILSGEFLGKYTIIPLEENLKHPVVMLKMDEKTYNCPFVDQEKGCTVYEDRPWSCRMFPVGVASPSELAPGEESFYFLLKEGVCKGFEECTSEWTVDQWIKDQNAEDYQEMGDLFKEISMHDHFVRGKKIEPVKLEMFYMVCYDIDRFRVFIFESTFLNRFNIDDATIRRMEDNDDELLKFGYKWLRLALFGEKVIRLRPEYMKPGTEVTA